jgi:hypothetical protein
MDKQPLRVDRANRGRESQTSDAIFGTSVGRAAGGPPTMQEAPPAGHVALPVGRA